jgi:hypothetical protein
MLNDQSTSHTLLKAHKETQPQNHFHLKLLIHTYTMEILIMQMKKSIITMSNQFMIHLYSMMMLMSGQHKLMKTNMALMMHVRNPLLKIFMNSIKTLLKCINFLIILCFNQKRLNNLTPSSMSLLGALFISMIMTIVGILLCFLIHVMNLLCIMTTLFDPGGYWWPPTFSDWLKIVFWQFWQFTIFSRFNFRGHFEGLNEGFLRSMCSMIAEGMIEPPK